VTHTEDCGVYPSHVWGKFFIDIKALFLILLLCINLELRKAGDMDRDYKKITFKIDDVEPVCRELFNQVCCYNFHESKGEFLSKVILELALKKFGEEGLNERIAVFESGNGSKPEIANE
jgi:hypothetical protein